MPYRVANGDLRNKRGDVIAKHGSLIEITDLPVPNRVSVPWLVSAGYLVPEDAAPPAPVPTPDPPTVHATSPKRDNKKE